LEGAGRRRRREEREGQANRDWHGAVDPLLPKPCSTVDGSKPQQTAAPGAARASHQLGRVSRPPRRWARASLPLRLLLKTHEPMWQRFAAPHHGPTCGLGPPGQDEPHSQHQARGLVRPWLPRPCSEGLMLFPTGLWQPAPPSPSPRHYPESRRCLRKTPQLRSRARRRSTGSSPRQGQGTTRSQEGREKGERRNPTAEAIPTEHLPRTPRSFLPLVPPRGLGDLRAHTRDPCQPQRQTNHSCPLRLRASATVTLTTATMSHINQR